MAGKPTGPPSRRIICYDMYGGVFHKAATVGRDEKRKRDKKRARPTVAALWLKTMPGKCDLVSRLLVLIVCCLGWAGSALAMDHVTLRRDEQELHVSGRLIVTAQDGGLLLMARDGILWAITPEELVEHTSDPVPFEPFTPEEISQRLLAELPDDFDVLRTAHYVICYNTSRAYAQWCGSLFERLYGVFTNYWTRKGLKLSEPEFPLVAVVFANQASYLKFTHAEVGDLAKSIVGFFSLRTNRMTMYDLTGIEALGQFRQRRGNGAKISEILARPEAQRTVSTIVHEATHQIAFNCGLHRRSSACPVWFSEGIAVYFETPDLRSTKGWRGIGAGAVNRPRLVTFQQYLQERPADSLRTLLGDDLRFRDPQQSLDAYAEAWSLTYFLIRRQPKQYLDYMKMLARKKPLLGDSPETRLAEFEEVFGDLEELDTEFLRYMRRVR